MGRQIYTANDDKILMEMWNNETYEIDDIANRLLRARRSVVNRASNLRAMGEMLIMRGTKPLVMAANERRFPVFELPYGMSFEDDPAAIGPGRHIRKNVYESQRRSASSSLEINV